MITGAGRSRLDELRIKQAEADPAQLVLPWGGRSARALIQGGLDERIEARKLSHEATPLNEDLMIDEQCRRHHYGW